MFVIDDLVREFLSYIKEARLRDRDARRTAILKAHNAVADLAKVFSTVETDMRREILRLTEKRNDPDGFEQQLQAMLFHDSFWFLHQFIVLSRLACSSRRVPGLESR